MIVLDGASQSFALERDGAWIAQELGQRLANGLETDPAQPLAPLLEACLTDLVDTYHRLPGEAPSSTVAMVRLNGDVVDVLVLCDSPVIVLHADGTVHEIRDDRLADTFAAIGRPDGLADMTDPRWIAAATSFEQLRNHPDGFWCASATPEAARYAIEWHRPAVEIDTILAMTDGASAGVDEYGIPPTRHEAIQLATADPAGLLALVHNTEASDPTPPAGPHQVPRRQSRRGRQPSTLTLSSLTTHNSLQRCNGLLAGLSSTLQSLVLRTRRLGRDL